MAQQVPDNLKRLKSEVKTPAQKTPPPNLEKSFEGSISGDDDSEEISTGDPKEEAVQEKSVIYESEDSEGEGAVANENDKRKFDQSVLHDEESPKEDKKEAAKVPTFELIPAVIEGELVVKTQQEGGSFGNDKVYFAKFFIGGQFLAFFERQDSNALTSFYIKLKELVTIEDMFNADVKQILIEYKEGKKEVSLVLVIEDPKVKDKWYNILNKYKNDFEYLQETAEGDYGLSVTQVKYRLTELFESGLTSLPHEEQTRAVQLRVGAQVRLVPHDQPRVQLSRGAAAVRGQQRLQEHVLCAVPIPARR